MSSAELRPKINKIILDNFKSLVDFEMELAAFTCLIGLNGAGKTTVLQAMDFLSQLMNGRLTEWLKQRDWKATDLLCNKLVRKRTIKFSVHLTLNNGQPAVWNGEFNTLAQRLYCSAETVTVSDKIVLKVAEGKYTLASQTALSPIPFTYQGSILSQLKDSVLTPELLNAKQTLQGIKSLELLSPHLMRQRARQADDVGVGGEKLSAFLASLPETKKQAIIQKMKEFYPKFVDYYVSSIQAGWKKLNIREGYVLEDQGLFSTPISTEARHINDGLLRLLTILAQTQTDHSFLLFDEIENGVNPELVEKLVNVLLNASQQVLVTTHSPMILNYLPDEVARESVMFIYRTREGHTKATPFFTIPTVDYKLGLLGPGEVFVDTDLTALVQELNVEQRPS
ncbi:MAG: AAA family ATPase [Candidatus Competibacteraceae bacterium]|nr:AAA family ATPase [Candidatus Competibacteraceae bacterium]